MRAPERFESGVQDASVTPRSIRHVPALDGLRALAIAVVVAYHADVVATPGGFLGVEVFFVLSGFLVSQSIIGELERSDRVNLRRYFARRARRLVPALVTMLAVVTLAVVVGYPDEISHLRQGLVGALSGSSNWVDIATGSSYFSELGRGPVLRHLWSFAVEVQGYIVLPLLIWAVWRLAGRHRRLTSLTMAGISLLAYGWQMVIAQGADEASRAYLGTDTRIGAIVLGSALALWPARSTPARLTSARFLQAKWLRESIALLGLGALGTAVVMVDGSSRELYRGILLGCALAAASVVWAAASTESTRLNAVLANRLMSWVGTRSYGIYLWHWPLFVLTRPIAGVPLDAVGLAWRLAVTAALAEASHRWIEARWLATPSLTPAATTAPRRLLAVPSQQLRVGASFGLCAALVVGVLTARPGTDEVTERLQRLSSQSAATPMAGQSPSALIGRGSPDSATLNRVDSAPSTSNSSLDLASPGDNPADEGNVNAATAPTSVSPGGGPTGNETTVTTAVDGATTTGAVASTTPTQSTELATAVAAGPPDITLIGDSVMLAASEEILGRFGSRAVVDASISRQFVGAVDEIRLLRSQGLLGPTVVIGLGTNGPFSDADFDAVMTELADVEQVAFVKVEVPRRWEKKVNAALQRGQERHPAVILIDWPAHVKLNDLNLPDGMHPGAAAAQGYANLIGLALGE
jgi:peptidoglycan/LPS O-acetylase OafA/YrhL